MAKILDIFAFIQLCYFLTIVETCSYPGHGSHMVTNMTSSSGDFVLHDTAISYHCDPGFELLGSKERICRKDGSWSGEQPVCAVNVGRHKMVPMISNFFDTEDPEGPQRILDGYFSTCSVATNAHVVPAFWVIDLLQVHEITYLELVFGEPMKDIVFEVTYGHKPDTRDRIPLKASPSEKTHSIIIEFELGNHKLISYDLWLSRTITARYLTVKVSPYHRASQVALCEVSIYSTTTPSPDQCRLDSIPQDLRLGIHQSTCYTFHNEEKLPWDGAVSRCSQLNASLVHDINKEANDYLAQRSRSIFSENPVTDAVWIGARYQGNPNDLNRESAWTWVTGKEIDEFVLSEYQRGPLEQSRSACLVMYRHLEWKWSSYHCGARLPWMCQYELPSCGHPDQKPYTRMLMGGTSIGDWAKYACPDGHAVDGPIIRYCSANGTWTEHAPTCHSVDCGEPEEMVNGSVSLLHAATTYGSVAEYSCIQSGQQLVGSGTRTCQRDGLWSSEIPSCIDAVEPQPQLMAPFSLEMVLAIAIGAFLLLTLVTTLTFLIIITKKRTKAASSPREKEDEKQLPKHLARFDSDDGMDELLPPTKITNGYTNGSPIRAYGDLNGKS